MAIRISSSSQVLFSNIHPTGIVNPSSGISFSVWVRKNNWTEAGTRSLIGIYEVSASGGLQFGLNQSNQGVINFWNWGGTSLVTYPVTSLTSNVWYHFCYTYDGTNSRLFLNGNLVATTIVSPQNVSINRCQVNGFPSLLPFAISETELSGEYEIDDLRIYSRPLSQNEIGTIFNLRGKDSIVYRIVLHYTFDGLSFNTPVSSLFDITTTRLELINFTAQPVFIDKFIYNVR